MSKIVFLALVAVLVVGAYAQEPHRCVEPQAMEAKSLVVDERRRWGGREGFFYDAQNERIASIDEIFEHRTRQFFHEIMLFREHKHYLIDLKSRNCTVRELNHPFHHLKIPSNATFGGEFYIGDALKGEGVLVTRWHEEDEKREVYWEGAYTAKGCIPVSDHFYSPETRGIHREFFDVMLGISDPNVFIPPPECNQ